MSIPGTPEKDAAVRQSSPVTGGHFMSSHLRSPEDYYDALDRYTVGTLIRQLGYRGAIDKCKGQKWHHLEKILRSEVPLM
jgi:hypothetical protein